MIVVDVFSTAGLSQLMIDLPEVGSQEAYLQEMGMCAFHRSIVFC